MPNRPHSPDCICDRCQARQAQEAIRERKALDPTDETACSPDDLRVRDADAVEVFIADKSGQRYTGSNFASVESARAWLTLQPNRDSLRVAMTAKFILENV